MRWKNCLLVIDFDRTITLKDTIGLLGQFGLDHSNSAKPWSYFTQAYLKDYRQHRGLPHHDLTTTLQHLNSFKPIELASLARINQDKIFEGLTSDMLFKKGKEYSQTLLRPNVISVLKSFPKKDIRIVSVNWSKDWILGFLHALDLPRHHVFANDIESGEILPMLVTTGDKQQTIESFKRDQQVIYVGDSLGDLEPLVHADLGIVMGQDPSLAETIETCQLNSLQHVDDWLEIKELI